MTLSDTPRPTFTGDLPPGWSDILGGHPDANQATPPVSMCGWDDAGVFHQWEPTEVIVRECMALIRNLSEMHVSLGPGQGPLTKGEEKFLEARMPEHLVTKQDGEEMVAAVNALLEARRG